MIDILKEVTETRRIIAARIRNCGPCHFKMAECPDHRNDAQVADLLARIEAAIPTHGVIDSLPDGVLEEFAQTSMGLATTAPAPIAQAQGDEALISLLQQVADEANRRRVARGPDDFLITAQAAALSAIKALASRPPAPVAQEPVAWRYKPSCSDRWEFIRAPQYMDALSSMRGIVAEPLYAAPAPQPGQKPLCEECGGIGERLIMGEEYSCPGCGGTGYARRAGMGDGEVGGNVCTCRNSVGYQCKMHPEIRPAVDVEALLDSFIAEHDSPSMGIFGSEVREFVRALARQLSEAQVPEHDTLSARDVKTLRRWSRDVERMAQTFNDDRACMCRAAGELLMAITVTRAALPAQPQEREESAREISARIEKYGYDADLVRECEQLSRDQSAPAAGESEGDGA